MRRRVVSWIDVTPNLIEENERILDLRNEIDPPRKEVIEYGHAMEAKLKKNDHKDHWRNMPIKGLVTFLKIEIAELDAALEFLSPDEAAKECVDIGNFAMMLRDVLLNRKG